MFGVFLVGHTVETRRHIDRGVRETRQRYAARARPLHCLSNRSQVSAPILLFTIQITPSRQAINDTPPI